MRTNAWAGYWLVERHSGRRNGVWRLLGRHKREQDAWESYARYVRALRQGAVRLVDVVGKEIAATQAPTPHCTK